MIINIYCCLGTGKFSVHLPNFSVSYPFIFTDSPSQLNIVKQLFAGRTELPTQRGKKNLLLTYLLLIYYPYFHKKTYYVENILVLSFNRYDDYDYGEINQLLDRSFKVYIKTVVCTPEKVTKRMYDSFWRQFKHSEKVSTYCGLLFNFTVILILLHLT